MSRFSEHPNDFRVETTRCRVIITMMGGDELRGSIFVHGATNRPDGAEAPADLFNAREPFFPFESEGGEVLLIAKRRVAEVSGDRLDTNDPDTSLPTALMQLVLADGTVRVGSVRLVTRAPRPRLLDHLNRSSDRFLTLLTSDGARLVNRELIERVTPLD